MAISGCIPIPVVETTGAKPGTIREGSTSKAKILYKFGYPIAKTSDGRFFLYDYSKHTEWCALGYGVAECGFFLSNKKGRVLIEFDNDNIVERYAGHVCNEPPDPLCDHSGIDAMWTSINQLAGKDIAAQYGQTLDEFRQAEALRNSRKEALVKAVKLADLEAVKRLIEEGEDVNAENRNGYKPLLAVASNGQVAIAKLLLSYGAAVNWQDKYGRTPLHEAVWNRQAGVTELLLAHGADVDTRNGVGDMPLHTAIRNADTKVVQLLLTHGANANAKAKGQRYRPVKVARDLGGREDIIELLKRHGGKE
jgi:hypothetical protein